MDTKKVIQERRSVHSFDPNKKVTDAQFKQLFDLVKLSPSGYNLQPWEFIVVRDAANKERLKAVSYNQPHIGGCFGCGHCPGEQAGLCACRG